MHVISRDSPCYLLTSVAKDRLPVFRTNEMKEIACQTLDEAHKSGEFALYAYVIMPDHLHAITDSARSSADTLRFIPPIKFIDSTVRQSLTARCGGRAAGVD